jgi:hypothetical protein
MTVRRFFPLILGCCALMAATGYAQTHAQLLEKAIFSEETAGDLDGAVRLYRQILASHQVPRDVAALAESRLAGTLRRTQRPQVAPAAAQQPELGCCGMFSGNYDPTQQITVVGIVRGMQWINPQAILMVDGSDGNRWGFTLPPPNSLIRGGLNKDSFKLGDQLLVTGFLATGTGDNCPATGSLTACAKLLLPRPDGQLELVHASASKVTSDTGTVIFDRSTFNRRTDQQP